MGFWLPQGETLANPDASAVLKGAPRKELARAFMEYSLSDAGQKLLINHAEQFLFFGVHV